MRTQAAILWEQGRDALWQVEDIELDPPRASEVLVRVEVSGLCHSDEHLRLGDLPTALPRIGGHEAAGVVEEVGPGVTDVAVGDHVVLLYAADCGRCPMCQSGHTTLCDRIADFGTGFQRSDGTSRHHARGQDLKIMTGLGTFSRRTVVHESSMVAIGKDIPFEVAALMGCAVPTGFGAAVYAAEVRPGDTVVVVGAGGVGACAIQGARLAGAAQIVAVDPIEFKRAKAQEFGATAVAADLGEARELVAELSGGRMFDRAINTIGMGRGDLMGPIMGLLGKRGRAVVMTLHAPGDPSNNVSMLDLTVKEKQIVGSQLGSVNLRTDVPRILELYRQGRFDLDGLVSRSYSLEQINEASRDLYDGDNIRGVLRMHSPASGN